MPSKDLASLGGRKMEVQTYTKILTNSPRTSMASYNRKYLPSLKLTCLTKNFRYLKWRISCTLFSAILGGGWNPLHKPYPYSLYDGQSGEFPPLNNAGKGRLDPASFRVSAFPLQVNLISFRECKILTTSVWDWRLLGCPWHLVNEL